MSTATTDSDASRRRAARVFLAFALTFGLAFALVTPPFQVADEFNHFFRAYHLAEGGIVAQRHDDRTGAFLPRSVWETAKPYRAMVFRPLVKQEWRDLRRDRSQRTDPNDRVFVDFPNTALYSPVPYVPQAVGITVGRLVDAPPVVSLYLARLLALAFWIACSFAAIRIVPCHAWVVVVLALTPMSLFQGASASADSVTNGVALVVFARLLGIATTAGAIRYRTLFEIIALTAMLSLCKAAYAPMVLLVAMIPAARFRSRPRYAAWLCGLTLLNAAIVLGWGYVAGQSFVPSGDYNAAVRDWQPFRAIASSNAQVEWIVGHPLEFLGVLGRTVVTQADDVAWSFVGSLGWLDAPIPKVSALVALIMITFVALADRSGEAIPPIRAKAVAAIVAAGLIVLMTTYVYLNWSPPAAPIVTGLQGRYFIPMAPLLTLLFANRRRPLVGDRIATVVILHLAAFLALGLWTLISRYYVG